MMAIICWSCSDAQDTQTDKVQQEQNVALDTIVHSIPDHYLAQVSPSNSQEIKSYEGLLELWKEHNYTPESWDTGNREVPRIFILNISEAWGDKISKEITVQTKKHIFFRGMAPLILYSNECIMKDRKHLEKIKVKIQNEGHLEQSDTDWLHKLALTYKLDIADYPKSNDLANALWERVDIIPTSLALAQAAIESGWGTSRFAEAGNSIFGQWAWGKDAIKPKEQRDGMGDYGIAAFASLQESVCAYMLNINTHNAYRDLRNRRAQLEKENQDVSGIILCEQLTKYSERGMAYVEDLKAMMNHNHLKGTDEAYLSDEAAIFLLRAETKE